MSSVPRIVGAVGVILPLIGGTGVAWGSCVQTVDDCESGSSLFISPHAASEDADLQTDPVAFGDLSPVEQRLFLEAYTSTDNSSTCHGSGLQHCSTTCVS